MKNDDIILGLKQLGFNSGWVVSNNQITLWENTESEPSLETLVTAAKDYKLAQKAEAEAKAQAKATAEGKLAALGLTTDDLRALGL